MDFGEIKWKDSDWIDFDKVRQKCRDVVETVTDILVLWNAIKNVLCPTEKMLASW